MIGNDIEVLTIVPAIAYESMPRGETPEATAIIEWPKCDTKGATGAGGVNSFAFFFFFFDFFELGVPVAGNAGFRETSILSAVIPLPSSAPYKQHKYYFQRLNSFDRLTCRARCVRNELRSANSLPHIKQRKNAFG